MNPFDPKAALLAKHAQHVVLVHFPIALFMTGVRLRPGGPMDEGSHEADNTGGSVTTQHPGRCRFGVTDARYRHRGLAVATGRAQTERTIASPRGSGQRIGSSYLPGCGDASSAEQWRRFFASTLLPAPAGPDRRGGCAYCSRRRFRERCQCSWLVRRTGAIEAWFKQSWRVPRPSSAWSGFCSNQRMPKSPPCRKERD